MFNTRITELLKIKYPIMQGGMRRLGTPELAAAVSNAGGLGTVNAGNYPNVQQLRAAIRKVKSLTANPFCVNVSMVPTITPGEMIPDYFRVIAEEGVAAVETAGRSPEEYVPLLKRAGIKLIHKVAAVKFARKAEEVGADIVTIVGMECAGRPGPEEVSTLILGNKTARTLAIPVFIAGGIADGRGVVAALALGAEGVVMGTRFLATAECALHPNFKEWMLKASESDTILIQRSIKNTMRVMKNKTALISREMESLGASPEELLALNDGERFRRCQSNGDVDGGLFATGQSVGLIDWIKPVQAVIDDIVGEVETVMKRLNAAIQ